MAYIHCHIHTPVNIEEVQTILPLPIIFEEILYVIEEKKLHDTLSITGYLKEYILYTRENGYASLSKWLSKKNLLNDGFLEAVSQYRIKNVNFKQLSDYKYFPKNENKRPVISPKYLKKLFNTVILYNFIGKEHDKFNEESEKELDIIEKELADVNNAGKLNNRLKHYKNNIFKILKERFLSEEKTFLNDERILEIQNLHFSCETLTDTNNLFVYKTGCIQNYKDFKFKLTKVSYKECLRGNTFVKFNVSMAARYLNDEYYLRSLLEELKEYSQIFTCDIIDAGVLHLKRVMGYRESYGARKMNDIAEYFGAEASSSNAALLQKTRTIVSEAENHIISQYESIKDKANMYFVSESDMTKLPVVLNLNKENLKRINNLIGESPYEIETSIIKFTFNKGKLPYSAYGFASADF